MKKVDFKALAEERSNMSEKEREQWMESMKSNLQRLSEKEFEAFTKDFRQQAADAFNEAMKDSEKPLDLKVN